MPISRVLIANRGEIAVRVIRAADALGIETVLAVSEPDRDSMAARMAGQVICIGPASASASYLNVGAVVMAAKAAAADAIHPGYGFLAESPDLADACADNGIKLVGPSADHMRQMGHKIEARALAAEAGVPTLDGSERVGSANEALKLAKRIGLPVMLKAASGGGGRGMKIITEAGQFANGFAAASAEARAAFGDYLRNHFPRRRAVSPYVDRGVLTLRFLNAGSDVIDADRLGAEIHLTASGDVDKVIILAAGRHLAGPWDLDVESELHHARRNHEDDQQHQHDINERRDIDLGDCSAVPISCRERHLALRSCARRD